LTPSHFLRTAQAWFEQSDRCAVELRASVGAKVFDERQDERRDAVGPYRRRPGILGKISGSGRLAERLTMHQINV
jgi:hypothetical protein